MKKYLLNRIESFGHAFRGIATLIRSEAHAKIHLVAIISLVVLGYIMDIKSWEWCAILGCMGLVLALEAVNTAIERLTDLASPDIHPLAKDAKDIAAGAVLIATIFSAVIWGIIFIPKF